MVSRTISTAASLVALLLCLCGFRAGDIVSGTFEALDASGYPTIPSTARAYWYVATGGTFALVDSADVLGSGIAALPRASSGNAGTYGFSFTLPATTSVSVANDYPQIFPFVRYTTSGGGITWTPANLGGPLNAGPDSLRVEAVQDFWVQVASATQATITGDVYGATEVTSNGDPVQGARVWVTRTNSPTQAANNLLGMDESSDAYGEFEIPVPISATSSDTYYLWAHKSGRYFKSGEVLTIP